MSTLKSRRNNDQRSDMRYSKEFKCQQKMNKWDMEDKCEWHGSAPNAEQYETAMAELNAALAELEA